MRRRAALFVALGGITWPALGQAQPLATPTGRVILEVTGRIRNTNQGDTAAFDDAMLEAIGFDALETVTPWSDGKVVRFEGVPLKRLLEATGAEGENLKITALNDYFAMVPVAEVTSWNLLLARRADGVTLTTRNKGPLWVIYPWSQGRAIDEASKHGSVWQVNRIVVQ